MLEKLYDKLNGFRPGGLYYFAGAPAVGKTSLMLNLALDYAQKFNKKVLIISLEMSKDEITYRNHQIAGKVTNIKKLPIYIDDDLGLTLNEIKGKIGALNPDIVFIDYLQLIVADIEKASRYTELSEIAYSLKCIAKSANIPIVISVQLKSNCWKQRPEFIDLRPRGIEQDGDVIMFLYDPDYGSRRNKAIFDIEIIVAKNRWGETFTLNSHLDSSTLRYKVCEDE